MADINIHQVESIHIGDVREHSTFISRTIVIKDEKGEQHEITLFSKKVDDEQALRVWL